MFLKVLLFAVVLSVVNSQYCSPPILPPCSCNVPHPALCPPCGCAPALPPLAPCSYGQPLTTFAPLPRCECLPNFGPILPAYDFAALPTFAPTYCPLPVHQNPCAPVAACPISNVVLPAAAPCELMIPRLPEALLPPCSIPLLLAPCGCQGLPFAVPTALVNPFLPAASPVSALAPTVSSLLPPALPCGCGSLYLRKIPISPPCL